jgi:hypothetical protein
MWRNPITEKQIRVLIDDWGVKEEKCAAERTRSITGWFQVLTVCLVCSSRTRTVTDISLI